MEKKMLKPSEICDEIVLVNVNKCNLSFIQTLILGILAGAFIAFGGFASSAVSHSIENAGLAKFIGGAVFPVGLILVIVCGAELFTGNCLMITAFMGKKIKAHELLRNWIIVYFSNFIGAILIAILIYYSGLLNTNNGKLGIYAIKTASYKCTLSHLNSFTSGILCNMMVCLAVWTACAAKDITGKILAIWFPIMTFVASGFEHSVANMYFLFIGLLAKSNTHFIEASRLLKINTSAINFSGIFENLMFVTLGNIIGGCLIGAAYCIAYKHCPSIKLNKSSESNSSVTINK